MNRIVRGGLALTCAGIMGSGMFAGLAGAHGSPLLPAGEYTAAQKTYAEDLVHRTEAALPKYTTGEELRARGYQNFGVPSPDGYWHWTKIGYIDDGKLIDPTAPESLVIRQTADGLKVEAAMFFLDSEHTMDNIPADLQWLPGWHSHNDELCHNDDRTFAGLQNADGTCSSGKPADTPPMMHVWTVDTPCGHRFAGVGIGGIDCLGGGHGGPDGHGPNGTTPHGTGGPMPRGTMPVPPATDPSLTEPTTAVRPATAVRAVPTFAG